MEKARLTLYMIFALLLASAPSTSEAQDRGVSIPDVFTPNPADAFVAQEITSALRIAGGMTPDWRPSTADLPLAELMRACGATLETDPDFGCMARMVVTRDPSMDGGLVLFASMERVGEANGFNLTLILYDMRTGEIARHLNVPVQRIMAPTARNRMAADWIRELMAPPVVAVSDPPDPVVEPDPDPDPHPVSDPVRTPEPGSPTPWMQILGWSAIIASAIPFSLSIYSWARLGDIQGDAALVAYRESYDGSLDNVCGRASTEPHRDERVASLCNEADLLESLQWAFLGSIALAGAGIVALALDGSSGSQERSVMLRPTVGRDRARLDLTVTF